MTHTPTPWKAEVPCNRGGWIMGADGKWSALSCGESDENAEANAAFIVRAVNCHDRLTTLASLVTVGQVLDAGDEAIAASGLNPWCVNEGTAKRDDKISLWWAKP